MTQASTAARRTLTAVALGAVALAGISYGVTAALRVRPPHALRRLRRRPPSAWGDEFPSRPVPASGPVRPLGEAVGKSLPSTVPWNGTEISLDDMLRLTKSRALVVLHDGRLVHEWYAEDLDVDARLPSWSVAKAVVSLLVGQAIGRGMLSEDDLLVDLLPELRTGTGYDEITVRDLLDMTSGIDIAEVYNPWWPFSGVPRLMLSTDLPRYIRARRQMRFQPGSRCEYRSIDTQMLGLILARIHGRPLAQIASEGLWTPIGAEADATWNLDREGGIEKAFCCVNARPRDLARIGQMVLDGGRVGDTQVVPLAWIERISAPRQHLPDGWGYSAHWWHPPTSDGDFTALGVFGQYICLHPEARTVIVKISDRVFEKDGTNTVDALRVIARHLEGG
ncbi:MAG TPA: serine hydrolase [Arachnia sp.]|nr:serine hydrolase [Arachnia sp.]HMT86134.1 serine hydrolase [Arachnia sp.]